MESTKSNTKQGGLMDRAVLISVKLGRYGTSRKMSNADIQTGADLGRIKVTKRILADPRIDAIGKYDTEIRKYVYSVSVPSFADEGIYLVDRVHIRTVDDALNLLMAERNKLVTTAADALEEIMEADRAALAEEYSPNEYPGRDEFIESHSMTWRWLSMSQPKDLDADIAERQSADEAKAVESAEQSILRLMRENFIQCVSHIVERLTPDPEGKPKIFRNSLLDSTKEFMASFAFRNLMQDDDLAALVQEMGENLEYVSAEILRTDADVRAAFLEATKDIEARATNLVRAAHVAALPQAA